MSYVRLSDIINKNFEGIIITSINISFVQNFNSVRIYE